MKAFNEKVKSARMAKGLSQADLAKLIGTSTRMITAYEIGEKKPRSKMLLKLSEALGVSSMYLSDDDCTDPTIGLENDTYIQTAYEQQGSAVAKDIGRLLAENTALFAGGELSQEQKDAFFEAIMKAYTVCKEVARDKYGKK